MIDDVSGDIQLGKTLMAQFGYANGLHKILLKNASVGHMAIASVFQDKSKNIYVYISSPTKLMISDIRKILSNMNLKAEYFLPPKNNPSYFTDLATKKFKEVFPGRKTISTEDLRFYKTLIPYNPALVKIAEIKDGVIKIYDPDAKTNWRPAHRIIL